MFCIIYSGKCSPFIKKLQTPANQIMNQNGACWINFLCWQMMIICLTICGSIIRRTRKLNGREGNWKPEGWVVAGVSYHCEIRNLKNHCGKCDICMFWCLYWNVKRCERYNFQNFIISFRKYFLMFCWECFWLCWLQIAVKEGRTSVSYK